MSMRGPVTQDLPWPTEQLATSPLSVPSEHSAERRTRTASLNTSSRNTYSQWGFQFSDADWWRSEGDARASATSLSMLALSLPWRCGRESSSPSSPVRAVSYACMVVKRQAEDQSECGGSPSSWFASRSVCAAVRVPRSVTLSALVHHVVLAHCSWSQRAATHPQSSIWWLSLLV